MTDQTTIAPDLTATSTPSRRPDPVVLLGIAPRSGTNYVYNLLRSHPDLHCMTSVDIPEDFVVKHSRLLARYADTLAAAWGQYWRKADLRDRGSMSFDDRRARIMAGLGRGMLEVIAGPDDGRRVVTKTPSVDELTNAFELFPDGKVLIVVRDGRAVCESALKSAGDPFELTMQRWARSARAIIDARATIGPDRLLVMRYEDVVADTHGELVRMLEFAGVDPTRYDRRHVDELPVLGSSQFYGQDGKNWQRVSAGDDFDPLQRYAGWTHDQLERFAWVAGAEADELGYEVDVECRTSDLRQRVRSVPWQARSTAKSVIGETQRRLYRLDVFGRRSLPFDIS